MLYGTFPSSPRKRSLACSSVLQKSCSYLQLLLAGFGLACLLYITWPRPPRLQVQNIKLSNITVHKLNVAAKLVPRVQLDVNLEVNISIKNPNVFALEYKKVVVDILYRQLQLGEINNALVGRVPSLSTGNMDANLDMKGLEVLGNGPALLEDVARGRVELTTSSSILGAVELLFFKYPLTVHVDCNLAVDPLKKVLLSRNCSTTIGL